jgi:hypothetical protein
MPGGNMNPPGYVFQEREGAGNRQAGTCGLQR